MSGKGNAEQVEIILAGRNYLYQILQALFAAEPESDLLKSVVSEDSRETIGMLFEPDAPEVVEFCACLKAIETQLSEQEEACLDTLRIEYTRLFLGPANLAAPPWESVYTAPDKTLFHESTLEVRRFYYRRNFLPTGYPHVADDHLAIELDFMYHLGVKTLECFTLGETGEVRSLIVDQKEFLAEHLLRWTGTYAADLGLAKAGPLYPTAARFTDFFLRADAGILDEVAAAIG